ncbi:MAG: hypothetical protein L6Q54_08265 [Leptospiraceae bacterium]|nr:hypothetical protein [Leptospiraceae bacterium]MCK6381229.1 hypothetical protein [Leptospiraceae bacterium]NUM40752.1 hypothetical protein [Leptospiraceae bacterium]
MSVSVLEILMISVGVVLGLWGIIHQLIVGGIVSLFLQGTKLQLRLVVLGWVGYGAFISFVGILTAVMVGMYGLNSPATRTVLFITVGAMTLFTGHTLISGLKIFPKPIRISFAIESLYILVCGISFAIYWLKIG